jgi:hypothetical protein
VKEAVSQLCKRTHPKSLSWKERDFSPPSLHKRRGKGDELFNLFITTQPQNEERIEKTSIGLLDTLRYSKTELNGFRVVLSETNCVLRKSSKKVLD